MGTKALPHAGMGVAQYTWATSPLRRYVDLVNQWQIIACARHGRTAALAAPFKPKDATLFSIISGFDGAYSAYNGFQSAIERFWTLRWIEQQGVTELDAAVLKDGLVRADTLPLVFRALGTESFLRGTRVRVRITGMDLLTLELHASLVARLEDEVAPAEAEDGEGEGEDDAPTTGLTLAINLDEAGEDAPPRPRRLSSPPAAPMRLPKLPWPPTLLQSTLLISVALHAVLLTIRFVDPERFNRVFEDTPLEVILVNARSNEKPVKAQAIAQADLAGGGNQDQGRATSPLPASDLNSLGIDTDEAEQQINQMQAQQQQLLADLRRQIALLPVPDPARPVQTPEEAQREERRRQMLRTLAEIESASTRRTPVRASATSAPPPRARSMRSTTTSCAARSRNAAPATSPNTRARSSMAS
jgi:hypothetical protein